METTEVYEETKRILQGLNTLYEAWLAEYQFLNTSTGSDIAVGQTYLRCAKQLEALIMNGE